ncbi:unnamed protein product [Jaminaea pallidilutea]
MHALRSILLALVAASTLAVASLDEAAAIGNNDMAARSQSHHARGRSVRDMIRDHGKRLTAKRRAQSEQEQQTSKIKAWADNRAKQNTEWQADAMEALKQGKTPQAFDTWLKAHGGDYETDSPFNDSSDDSDDDSNDDDSDDDDASTSTASSAAASSTAASRCNRKTRSHSRATSSASPSAASSSASASASLTNVNNIAQNIAAARTTSTAKPAASTSSSSNSSNKSSSGSGLLSGAVDVVSGTATYYYTGLGACGWTNKDSDYIVALPVGVWNRLGGTVSNGNIVCGKKIKVSNGSTSITVEVTDQCPSCDDTHLDLSPSAFEALGSFDKGVLQISWGWVGSVPSKS